MARRQVSRKRRVRKNIENDVVHICPTLNNAIVITTDEFGNALSWLSAGTLGFEGSKKSALFAAQMASEAASKSAMEHDLKTIEVTVEGPGPDRKSAIRALQSAGLEVVAIRDVTPVPHNDYRPLKRRRV